MVPGCVKMMEDESTMLRCFNFTHTLKHTSGRNRCRSVHIIELIENNN